jgi:hypothetical protein
VLKSIKLRKPNYETFVLHRCPSHLASGLYRSWSFASSQYQPSASCRQYQPSPNCSQYQSSPTCSQYQPSVFLATSISHLLPIAIYTIHDSQWDIYILADIFFRLPTAALHPSAISLPQPIGAWHPRSHLLTKAVSSSPASAASPPSCSNSS